MTVAPRRDGRPTYTVAGDGKTVGKVNRPVLGRARELETGTAELAAVVAAGAGSCLVLEGEPGLGKTTLVAELATRAGALGFRQLRCAGVHSQSGIGFAGLHELIYPLLSHAQRLPARQRVAVLTAFGMEDGPPPERLLVSLAVLGLIEEASQEQPLLLIVDDAQWLDLSTLDVLTFVGRRLGNAAAMLLCALRPDQAGQPAQLLDLPRVPLAPLPEAAAADLLDKVVLDNPELGTLDRLTRSRILREASGNPLAVIELATAVADSGLRAQAFSEAPLPTTRRIENAFLAQLACLRPAEQTLLLLVAAAGSITMSELVSAGEPLGITDREFGTLHSCGLMKVQAGEVEVRHPLIRSAVYGAANVADRAAAHRALAAAVGNRTRATWHRSAATFGPDEAVASELQQAAAAAGTHGAYAESAAALRRAAAVTPDGVAKVYRLTCAAEAARRAGLGDEATQILDEAVELGPSPEDAVQLEITRYVLAAMGGAPGRSATELALLADDFGRGQAPGMRHGQAFMLAAAAIRWQMYGRRDGDKTAITAGLDRARSVDAASPAVAAMLDIAEAAVEHRRQAATFGWQAKVLMENFHDDPLLLSAISLAGEYTWNLEAAEAGWAALGAAVHSPAHECDGLRGRAQMQLHRGALREAEISSDAALRLAEGTGLCGMAAASAATLARALAWKGDFAQAQSVAARGYGFLRTDPDVVWNAHLQWSTGLVALATGDPDRAVAELTRLVAHPQIESWAVGDLTEAAIAAGRADLAEPAVGRVVEEAAATDSAFLTMLAQRCLAQLATDPDDAEARFVAAVSAGTNSHAELELARTRLAFGQWLRRRRRIVASRDHLTAAANIFGSAGARPWADVARSELRAAGVNAVTPSANRGPALETLTAQELHIAQLAADGLTNREIADRIYLSHRTVAAHLYRVFPKLGVTTRSQLAAALGGSRLSG